MRSIRRSIQMFVSVLVFAALAETPAYSQESAFTELVRFSAADTLAGGTFAVGRDIALRIRAVWDAHRTPMGWDFSATDKRLKTSPDFFYKCLCGHGPRPHDYFAWHFEQKYFPHERVLPVYGYPFEIRVACDDCEITGSGERLRFLRGTVIVGVRRLRESNPRQIRPKH